MKARNMGEKNYALLGILGPLTTYALIAASIILSPWFCWEKNALSDLGHAIKSQAAPIFNFGLFLGGFLLIIYSMKTLVRNAKYSGLSLLVASLLLQLIALFNETYPRLHYAVSVLFFIAIIVGSLAYAFEAKSPLGVVGFIVGFGSWIIYFMAGTSIVGVAVPETISSTAALLWVAQSTIKAYSQK